MASKIPQYKIFGKLDPTKPLTIFCGGDGDTIGIETDFTQELVEKLNHPVCIFNYIGGEKGEHVLFKKTYAHLESLMSHIVKNYKFSFFNLISTSMGAASMTYVISLNKFDIVSAIYLDPGDYYQDEGIDELRSHLSWRGADCFKPKEKLVSSLLNKLTSPKTKIHLIELKIRNCSSNSYIESDYSKRNIGYKDGYPRHNAQMKRGFINNAPVMNRGEHIENWTIPHAIFRDGDVKYNIEELTNIISGLINSSLSINT